MTKRDLVVKISKETGIIQSDVADIVQLTLDNTAPEILNASSLQESLVFEGERTYLKLDILENEKLAAVVFMSNDGRIMGKYELENVPGETLSHTFDITGFGNSFSIVAADYAVNETEIDAFLNLGEQNNARPKPQALDQGRLYGCETFDAALVEGGAAKKKRACALLILIAIDALKTARVECAAHQLTLVSGNKTLLPKLVHTRDGDGVVVLKTEVAAGAVEEILGGKDGCHSGILRM